MASNAVLATSFISVQGFETNSAARYATYKAKRINNLEVCFNLAGNEQITPGNKTVYVQIINPDNNVLADKGVVKNDEHSLVYSFKTNVEYYNQNTKVCVAIEADRDDKPLQKGNYKINIFNDFTLIGSTELHLE
jgi:propanediol utilization protein